MRGVGLPCWRLTEAFYGACDYCGGYRARRRRLRCPHLHPLSYSTTFTDPSGTPQSVTFTGTASGTALTGTLTVAGDSRQVTATIGTDGSVSGKLLAPDGSQDGLLLGPVDRRDSA